MSGLSLPPGSSSAIAPLAAATQVAVAETTVAIGSTAELGKFLTDAHGMTLYAFTRDTEQNASVCEGDCLVNWPAFTAEEPLTLPEGVEGVLTLVERADGSMQVACNGMPLHYGNDDGAPDDTT